MNVHLQKGIMSTHYWMKGSTWGTHVLLFWHPMCALLHKVMKSGVFGPPMCATLFCLSSSCLDRHYTMYGTTWVPVCAFLTTEHNDSLGFLILFNTVFDTYRTPIFALTNYLLNSFINHFKFFTRAARAKLTVILFKRPPRIVRCSCWHYCSLIKIDFST